MQALVYENYYKLPTIKMIHGIWIVFGMGSRGCNTGAATRQQSGINKVMNIHTFIYVNS